MDIDMEKHTYSYGEFYGIEIELEGNGVKNVQLVLINTPNGKRMWLKNSLGLNEICLVSGGMS